MDKMREKRLRIIADIRTNINKLRDIDVGDSPLEIKERDGINTMTDILSSVSRLIAHDIVHTAKENK